MKYRALLSLILTFTFTSANAASYSNELIASYLTINVPSNFDTRSKAVGIAHYFTDVKYSNRDPYAWAPFVQEAAYIGFIYSQGEIETGTGFDIDQESFLGLGKFYIPHTPFNIEASLRKTNVSNGRFADSESDWGITGGWKPTKYIQLSTSYWHDLDYDLNLEATYLTNLPNKHHLGLEAIFEKARDKQDKNFYSLEADYYPALSTSFGVTVSKYFETAYGMKFRHFFTPSVHGQITYNKEKEVKAYEFMIGYRF